MGKFVGSMRGSVQLESESRSAAGPRGRGARASQGFPSLWERCHDLVRTSAARIARAPPGHPVAITISWHSPLWWRAVKSVGGVTWYGRHRIVWLLFPGWCDDAGRAASRE